MKKILIALLALSSWSSFAGDCKITANPRSEWENVNGGVIFPLWMDRETQLTDVSIEECISSAVKEIDIPYSGQFEIKNVVYKFTQEDGVRIKGKVSK